MSDPVLDALDAALSSSSASPAPEALNKAAAPPKNDYVIDNNETLKAKQAKRPEFGISFREERKEEERKDEKTSAVAPLKDTDSRLAFGALGFTDTQAVEIIDLAKARREVRWHLDHGERVPRDICAGCRRPFRSPEVVLDLADDYRVHFPPGDNGYDCLIRHGERWRRTAREMIARSDRGPSGVIPDLPSASPTVADAGADPTTPGPSRQPRPPCPQHMLKLEKELNDE
jgi:hypothetical protein